MNRLYPAKGDNPMAKANQKSTTKREVLQIVSGDEVVPYDNDLALL